MQEDITERRDCAEEGHYKWMIQDDIINGRDDAGRHYKQEQECKRRDKKEG